ncbi:MAG: TIR domain-containing protein [Chloroflexota bacterium]
MAHDVFISYSNKDKPVADAVVAGLENEGIRCWVAPRDVIPGTSWGDAIVDAIEASQIMVVILSQNSNRSRQVISEVERAVHSGVVIIPFRIDDIDPTGAMALFLSTGHWLDALTPPLEEHIEKLGRTIRLLLSEHDASQLAERLDEPVAPPTPRSGRWQPLVLAGVLLSVVAVAAIALAIIPRLTPEAPSGVSAPPTATAPPATPSPTFSPTATSQPTEPGPTSELAVPVTQASPTESVPSAPPSAEEAICPERIGFGETIRCSIDSPGETDTYTFTADAGDDVLVRMSKDSGDLWPGIRVYDPDGLLLCEHSAATSAEIASCSLPGGGTYSILTFDGFNGTRTGDYYLHLQRLSNPDGSAPIAFGQTLSGSILAPAHADTYTFAADAGDDVLVRMSKDSGDLWPGIRVYDPDGLLLCEHSAATSAEIASCSLPGGGTYSILTFDGFNGTRTGDYYLYLQRLSNPGGSAPIGDRQIPA